MFGWKRESVLNEASSVVHLVEDVHFNVNSLFFRPFGDAKVGIVRSFWVSHKPRRRNVFYFPRPEHPVVDADLVDSALEVFFEGFVAADREWARAGHAGGGGGFGGDQVAVDVEAHVGAEGEGEVGPNAFFDRREGDDLLVFFSAFADGAFGLAGGEEADPERVAGVAFGLLEEDRALGEGAFGLGPGLEGELFAQMGLSATVTQSFSPSNSSIAGRRLAYSWRCHSACRSRTRINRLQPATAESDFTP